MKILVLIIMNFYNILKDAELYNKRYDLCNKVKQKRINSYVTYRKRIWHSNNNVLNNVNNLQKSNPNSTSYHKRIKICLLLNKE